MCMLYIGKNNAHRVQYYPQCQASTLGLAIIPLISYMLPLSLRLITASQRRGYSLIRALTIVSWIPDTQQMLSK
jgi:hypothetical protein